MIERAESRPDQPRMKIRCDQDGCDAEEVFPCQFDRGRWSDSAATMEGQARRRAANLGWRIAGKKLFCPAHGRRAKAKEGDTEVAQKEIPVAAVVKVDNSLRQPSMEQKRAIMALLQEVYDVRAGRYGGTETDRTVSETVGGGCMPGWVAQIRGEFFGPDGGNEAIDLVKADIAALSKVIETACEAVKAEMVKIEDARAAAVILMARIDKIKAAVGPRAANS